jgi:ABC-type glutathione transport system ATPase component
MSGVAIEVRGAVSAARRGDGRPVLDGVDLVVAPGARHGIVGASGSGKTSLLRAVLGRLPLAAGAVLVDGVPVHAATAAQRVAVARRTGFVPQDARGSLDPSMAVWRSVTEGLRLAGRLARRDARAAAAGLLERVGLDPDLADRLPHELSGGQCQRVCIARAIAEGPGLIVADEPTSALDPLVQKGILELLADVRAAAGATLLLVSHDADVVRCLCDTVTTIESGRVV